MKIDIEQPEHEGWKDWIVIESTEEHVSICRDYQNPNSDERKTWCDEGIALRIVDLPRVIEALQRVLDEKTVAEGEKR